MSRYACAVLLGVTVSACSKAPPPPVTAVVPSSETPPPEATEARGEGGPLLLAPEVATAAGVKLEPAVMERPGGSVELLGEVVADPDRVAHVVARAPGRVLEARFREGDEVRKDQVLVVIESPDLARARAALTAATARANAARDRAARTRALVEERLATPQQAAVEEAEAAALDADVLAARQALSAWGAGPGTDADAARLVLRAPISGTVIHRDATMGQGVSADHRLATIVGFETAHFHARIMERDLSRVREGQAASVRLQALPGREYPGEVERVLRSVEDGDRSVVAHVVIRDVERTLRLGLYGTATLAVDAEAADPVVLVPLSALVEVEGRTLVFVEEAGGRFAARDVVTGLRVPPRVEVRRGVKAGERVVVEGAFTLKSMMLKATLAEEDE